VDALELRQTLFRFREARALCAGQELGVYEALAAGPQAAPALAQSLELHPDALRVLLDALVAIGVLTYGPSGYGLDPESAEMLLPGRPGYLGHLLLHDLWHWSTWAKLDDTIRSGDCVRDRSRDPHLGSPETLRAFLPNYVLAMEQSARDSQAALVDRIVALEPRRVADLGGGSGTLLLAVLERLPAARGVLVEHPFSLPRAQVLAEASPCAARLELCAADLEKDELPADLDLAILSRVLMGLPPERALALVQRVAEALRPDGALLVHDFDARSRVGALLSLDMRLNTGGEVHPEERMREFVERSGLRLVAGGRLLPYTRYWVARRRSAALDPGGPA